ncbi:MAG: glycosyltransferase family 2 protein [Pseudomonadota bacterium]
MQKKYISTGNDPALFLHKNDNSFINGWVRLKVQLSSNQLLTPHLYFDNGSGFSECKKFTLPFFFEGEIDFLCRLPEQCVQLRLDPMEQQGELTIEHIQLFSVSKIYVLYQLLFKKLSFAYCSNFIKHTSLNVQQIKIKLIQDLSKGVNLSNKSPSLQLTSYKHWEHFHNQFLASFYVSEIAKDLAIDNNPKFYIVVILADREYQYFDSLIQSIKKQSYTNWHLLVFSEQEKLAIGQLREEQYSSINTTGLSLTKTCNLYLTQLLNKEQSLLLFVEPDTELSPYALAYFYHYYKKPDSFKLCYADHDSVDQQGINNHPVFKPDYDYFMLLSFYYFSNLVIYESKFFLQIGGFNSSEEIPLLWDLALRASEACSAESILHIPAILSHNHSADIDEKQTKNIKIQDMLKEHLLRNQFPVESISISNNQMAKIYYKKIQTEPLVSIIIPTKNGYEILKQCIDSIFEKTDYDNFEIIIVDNQSDERETLDYLDDLSIRNIAKILKYDHIFNYSAINNYAVSQSQGSILLFLNNDIEVISSSWLTEMVNLVQLDKIGAVGAKLLYPDDNIQHAGVILGLFGVAGHTFSGQDPSIPLPLQRMQIVQQYSAITAACLAVKRSDFLSVSGFNEQKLSIAFNDVDLCLKLRKAGFMNLWTPFACLYHHESISRGSEDTKEKQQRFLKEVNYMKDTWSAVLDKDPFYNANLSLEHLDFRISEVPRLPF